MDNKVLKKLKSVTLGDSACVEWFDASMGRSLGSGVVVEVPARSRGIYIGVLGKWRKHIIMHRTTLNIQTASKIWIIRLFQSAGL